MPNPALPRRIGRPWLSYGIADVRGLVGTPTCASTAATSRWTKASAVARARGVHVRLAAPLAGGRSCSCRPALGFALGGTESLALVPLAKSNMFELAFGWPHPQLRRQLPAAFAHASMPRLPRAVGGLVAGDQCPGAVPRRQDPAVVGTTSNRRDGVDAIGTDAIDAVGVSLVDPVNVYSQADRATKYGLLFVLLTFVGFFLFELIKQLPIHPIQYGLVGLSLAIFFLLLVSLSEHIDFGWAYLVASVACIGLIGFYLSAVLRSAARGVGFAAMLATLYGALYGLLVSEDNALVLGAGLLFLVLAAIMVVTRKVDWYQIAGSRAQPGPCCGTGLSRRRSSMGRTPDDAGCRRPTVACRRFLNDTTYAAR